MDALELALMEAWETVGARLLERPWELVKRMERVRRAELRRPVRAWSVAVRASDMRIGVGGGSSALAVAGRTGRAWGDFGCERSFLRAQEGVAHRVTLTGPRLAELVKPVRLEDLMPIAEAAELLGRDVRTVYSWATQGVLPSKLYPRRCGEGRGYWCVETVGLIDPQADNGRWPGPWWGTCWRDHWTRVPADLRVRLRRVPRLRTAKLHRRQDAPGTELQPKWAGWDWRCPGRVVLGRGGQMVRVACGRVCKKLWLPLPSWGLGQFMVGRDSAGEAVWRRMAVEGLFGVGVKGVAEAGGGLGPPGNGPAASLACAKCWGLRHEPMTSADDRLRAEAWNRLVTVISGGLLYGREVAQPG